jgi:hypothetical protein
MLMIGSLNLFKSRHGGKGGGNGLVLVFEGQAKLYYCDNDLNFMS